jgi:hypothetical protein
MDVTIKEDMKAQLYRLFAVQNFGKRIENNPGNIAVYVKDGDYPDLEILTDAQEIAIGAISKTDLHNLKPEMYAAGEANREKLTYLIRLFNRSQEVIKKHPNTKYAVFVNSRNHRDWHGEKTLYLNRYFDEVKTDKPTFSGCKPVRTIKL